MTEAAGAWLAVVVRPQATAETSTSVLAWELLGRPPQDGWLALLGAAGDLGDAAFELGLPAPRSRTATKRLATLVTAAGRVRSGPVAEAFALLAGAGDEREALAGPALAALEEARASAGAARARAMKTAPVVGPDAALIRFSDVRRLRRGDARRLSRFHVEKLRPAPLTR